ncbi:hypothetical protein F4678DRAFT_122038 [Xylaria arbuscula]|nr:hypothetical protein F4678DRAFT_122038 [Xylaria arbuscula]
MPRIPSWQPFLLSCDLLIIAPYELTRTTATCLSKLVSGFGASSINISLYLYIYICFSLDHTPVHVPPIWVTLCIGTDKYRESDSLNRGANRIGGCGLSSQLECAPTFAFGLACANGHSWLPLDFLSSYSSNFVSFFYSVLGSRPVDWSPSFGAFIAH